MYSRQERRLKLVVCLQLTNGYESEFEEVMNAAVCHFLHAKLRY